jgi:hypothetical protein
VVMNPRRWWCAVTAHRWTRTRTEGIDLIICNRCGFTSSVDDERSRGWEKGYHGDGGFTGYGGL